MKQDQATKFIQSFFDPKTDDQKMIVSKLSSIFERDDGIDYTVKLSAMLLLLNSRHPDEIVESKLDHVASRFDDVVRLIIENKLLLPEEECMIETAIKMISEDGEMVTSSAIESATPRIKPENKYNKKTKSGNEYEEGDLGFDKMIERK